MISSATQLKSSPNPISTLQPATSRIWSVAVVENLRLLRQFDILLIDEAQDTNVTGRGLAKALLSINGTLTAVGDDWQTIYGFAGADNDSLDIIKREFSAEELWLSVCFPLFQVGHLSRSTNHATIQPAPSAPEGSVTSIDYLRFLKLTPDKTSAILCRKNAL